MKNYIEIVESQKLRFRISNQFFYFIAIFFFMLIFYGCWVSSYIADLPLSIRAVNKIKDQNTLYEIALCDENIEVKTAAFNKITEQNLINKLAIESQDRYIRELAVIKITDQNALYEIYRDKGKITYSDYDVGILAIRKITDQNILFKAAMNWSQDLARGREQLLEAVINKINNITDQIILFRIALDSRLVEMRRAAFYKITDQILINKLAIESQDKYIRELAVKRVTDQNILYKVALDIDNWSNYKICVAAMKRLTPSLLAQLTTDSKEIRLKFEAINLLSNQTELLKKGAVLILRS